MFKDNFQLTTMNCIDIYMFSALNIRNSYKNNGKIEGRNHTNQKGHPL